MMEPSFHRSGGRRVSGLRRPRVAGRPARGILAAALLLPHLTGCFHHVPVPVGTVPAGAEVSVGLTDAGRLDLTERMGPGIRRIDGRVSSGTDSTVVLAVTSVQYYDLHIPMRLEGDPLEVRHEHIAEFREKRMSRSRTGIMAGVVAAGAVAASLIAITGFGSGGDRGPRDGPGNGQDQ